MRPLRPIGAGATRTDKPSKPQSAHHKEARSSFSSVETGASTWNDADTVGIAWAVTGIGAPVTSGIAVPIGAHWAAHRIGRPATGTGTTARETRARAA